MLLVFCPNKSILGWSMQWSILRGLHFLSSPKNKKSKWSIFPIYSLNPWNSIKLWTLKEFSQSNSLSSSCPIPQFLNISFSMLLYYSPQQKCLIPPKHLFLLKQSKNHQCSSSSVNPIYKSPLFSLGNCKEFLNLRTECSMPLLWKIFLSKTQSTGVDNDEIRFFWNYCIFWAIR